MAKEEQIKTSIDLTGEKEYRAACTNICFHHDGLQVRHRDLQHQTPLCCGFSG